MRIGVRGVTRGILGALAGLGIVSTAPPAAAHGNPPDLAFYGGFGPSAVRCQRVVARAASQCVAEVVQARDRCMNAQLGGGPCDAAAVDAAVQAADQHASDRIQRYCTEADAANLQFGTVADAQRDATKVCGELESAAVSATYGPALLTGSTSAVDQMPRTCMEVTAAESARLLRFAAAAQEAALDRIAASNLTPTTKQRLIDRAARRIAHARAVAKQEIAAVCGDANFTSVYGRSLDTFLNSIQQRSDCFAGAAYVQAKITCPTPVCGNGMQEPGEECDDGNDYNADGCRNDCRKNNCQVFPSTFDLIQKAVFEKHSCTESLCHGDARQGGLDLRDGNSYAALVDAPSQISLLKRVEPGIEGSSLLYLKLAAATLNRPGVPGSAMPQNLPPLSANELEAVRRWIYAGAPRTGVVEGTADLLNACLPPPAPIQIRPPAPPAPGTGVQLHMASWIVPAKGETEVCFVSYYDLTDQVPPQFRGPSGTTFRINRQMTTQDPLSHHLVVNYYRGEYAPQDPVWGTYECRGGLHDGASCDPVAIGQCGAGGECATTPVKSIACIGFGPPDSQITITSLGFGGTQQPVAATEYPQGVYGEVPLKGIILWNSHAFNLTEKPGKLEAWVNFEFAAPADQQHPVQDILNIDKVFAMNVPAFSSQEVCNVHVVAEGTQLFQISSHMHKRGKRFRIFRGAWHCQAGSNPGAACPPLGPDLCGGAPCVEDVGGDANQSLMYTSLIYNDPITLRFNPPLVLTGSPSERSLTYCALYDNGFNDPSEVKRKSTSPPPPFNLGFGGPCATPTHCVAGKFRAPCTGHTQTVRNASCDSSPGAGDGFCDACTLTGGVTTEDEMFILLGEYFFR